jgi:glutamyl-Q tRNA(Asp) synthetase
LHAGSLLTALGSYLSARSQQGRWLIRMEDLDAPRCSPQAASTILRQLEVLGFEWDGEVMTQSSRNEVYRATLQALQVQGQIYPCTCSRRDWVDTEEARVYTGTCRERNLPLNGKYALRLRVGAGNIGFHDRIQGYIEQSVSDAVGDFVLLRADGYVAYQLAVVIDDAECGITEVVRGADLLDSTPRQIYLQNVLGLSAPNYAHLPLLVNAAGQKLSKQTYATPIAQGKPLDDLRTTMALLGHPVPPGIDHLNDFWLWALAAWSETNVPKTTQLLATV